MASEEDIDESNQLLVVIVDVNPNQLMFARKQGLFYKFKKRWYKLRQLWKILLLMLEKEPYMTSLHCINKAYFLLGGHPPQEARYCPLQIIRVSH